MQLLAFASVAMAGLAAAYPSTNSSKGDGDPTGLPLAPPTNWPKGLPWPPNVGDLPIPLPAPPPKKDPNHPDDQPNAAPSPAPFVPYFPGFVCERFTDVFDDWHDANPSFGLSTAGDLVGESAKGVLRYDGYYYYSEPDFSTTFPLVSGRNAIGGDGSSGAPYIVGKNATTWFGLSSVRLGCGFPFDNIFGRSDVVPVKCDVKFTAARADNSVVEQTFQVASESMTVAKFDQKKFYALRNVSMEVVSSQFTQEGTVAVLDDVSYGACFMRS